MCIILYKNCYLMYQLQKWDGWWHCGVDSTALRNDNQWLNWLQRIHKLKSFWLKCSSQQASFTFRNWREWKADASAWHFRYFGTGMTDVRMLFVALTEFFFFIELASTQTFLWCSSLDFRGMKKNIFYFIVKIHLTSLETGRYFWFYF